MYVLASNSARIFISDISDQTYLGEPGIAPRRKLKLTSLVCQSFYFHGRYYHLLSSNVLTFFHIYYIFPYIQLAWFTWISDLLDKFYVNKDSRRKDGQGKHYLCVFSNDTKTMIRLCTMYMLQCNIVHPLNSWNLRHSHITADFCIFQALQLAGELYTSKILEASSMIANHSKRKTTKETDVQLLIKLKEIFRLK